jgi:hypothetical protein
MKKVLFIFFSLVLGISTVQAVYQDNTEPTYRDSTQNSIVETQERQIDSYDGALLDFEVSEPSGYQSAPNGYYTNTQGNSVPRPYAAPSKPSGATAKCKDGTYSYSQSRSGTCSHHGGVLTWY